MTKVLKTATKIASKVGKKTVDVSKKTLDTVGKITKGAVGSVSEATMSAASAAKRATTAVWELDFNNIGWMIAGVIIIVILVGIFIWLVRKIENDEKKENLEMNVSGPADSDDLKF